MLPVKLLSFLFHLQNTRHRESTNHPGTPVLSLLVYPQKYQKTTRSPRGSRRGQGREGDIQVPDYFPCEDPPAKGEIQGADSFFSFFFFFFSLRNETKLWQDLKLLLSSSWPPAGLGEHEGERNAHFTGLEPSVLRRGLGGESGAGSRGTPVGRAPPPLPARSLYPASGPTAPALAAASPCNCPPQPRAGGCSAWGTPAPEPPPPSRTRRGSQTR